MIIDAHMHLWNQIHGTINGETPVVPLKNGVIRIGDREVLGMPATHVDCTAPAEWALAEFDAAGVDAGVVVQEYLDGEQNEYLLEVMKRYPDRFFMHALPDFFQIDRVVVESFRLFERGFRGLKVSGMHLSGKVQLDDARLMPLWQRMEAERYVLAIDLSIGDEQVPALDDILNHFPKLHVAIGHFGLVTRGDWLNQIRLARYDNVYVEMGGIIWLFRHEGYPFPGAIDAIETAIKEIGVEKIMWGSDWPRTTIDFTYRQSLAFVRDEENGFSDNEKAMLLGKNAARLYCLKVPDQKRAPLPLITEG